MRGAHPRADRSSDVNPMQRPSYTGTRERVSLRRNGATRVPGAGPVSLHVTSHCCNPENLRPSVSHMSRSYLPRVVVILLTLFLFPMLAQAQNPAVDTARYAGLKWREIGPFRGGRVDAVTGVVGQPLVYYMGA